MKRPVAIVGFTFLLAQLFATFGGFNVALSLFVFFMVLSVLILAFMRQKKYCWVLLVSFSIALSLGMFSIRMYSYNKAVDSLEGKEALIKGHLVELPQRSYDRYYYIVETLEIDVPGAPQKLKIRLSSRNPLGIEPFEEFSVKVKFISPSGSDRLFDSRISSRAKGIVLYAYFADYNEEVVLSGVKRKPFYYYALKMRQHAIETIDGMLPLKQAALVKSVVLGEISDLDAKLVNDFRVTGTSHVFSVSGLHFAVIIQLIMSMFLFLKVPKRFAALLTILPVIVFSSLVGFSPPVVRSGIMMTVYLSGLVLGKEPDSLNSLGFAALLVLLFNPFWAGDIGFLLSFFATFGIIAVSPKINDVLSRPLNKLPVLKGAAMKLSNSVAVTLGATLTTLPVMLLSFEGFSNIAIIGNLLIVPPCMVVMIAGALAAIFNLLGPLSVAALPFTFIAGVFANFVRWLTGFLAGIPFVYHSVSNDFTVIWIAGTALLFFAAWIIKKNTSLFRLASILSVIVLLSGILSYQVFMRGVATISVLNVGEGKAVVFVREGRGLVIGCGGGTYSTVAVANTLRGRNVGKIDLMVLPYLDKGNASAAPEILKEYKVDTLVMPQSGRYFDHIEAALNNAVEKIAIDSYKIGLWKDMKVEIVEQGDGVWVFADYKETRVLVCPDEGDALELPEEMRRVDLLVCGAKVPANIAKVEADHAIVSTEEERAAIVALQLQARGFDSCFTTAYQDVTILTRGAGKLVFRSGK